MAVGHWATNCLPTALTTMTAEEDHQKDICLIYSASHEMLQKERSSDEEARKRGCSFLVDETAQSMEKRKILFQWVLQKAKSSALCNLEMIFYDSYFLLHFIKLVCTLFAQTKLFVHTLTDTLSFIFFSTI